MIANHDARSPDDLWAALMDGVEEADDDVLITAAHINRQSAARLDTSDRQVLDLLNLRFTGRKTQAHQLGVRAATKAILALQESLSSVGASILDHVTRAGRIPAEILSATELRFTPRLAPGSLEFTLVHPEEDALFETGTPDLFDQSFTALLDLFIDLRQTDLDNTAVVERLRGFGPRTAKHLFDLCQVLLQEELGVDFVWEKKSGRRAAAAIDQRSAAYLKELAQNNTTSVRTRTLVGSLTTVSEIDKQAILLDDASKIMLDASAELQDALQRAYRQRVEATVTETLNVNLATGVETRTYALIAIESVAGQRDAASKPLRDETEAVGEYSVGTSSAAPTTVQGDPPDPDWL
ncbi:hypothetical protein [Specibacter sp. RAF43]|uniref:hypothetical protein n=1 Tax=Specibacter sp. RAF43 TaxID=3233057 RepID=UPI003F986367